MMDSTQPNGNQLGDFDAYQKYLNSGQLTAPSAPQALQPMPPAAGAPSAAAPAPTFADIVKQHEAANGGKPLDDATLNTVAQNVWAQEEPAFRASRKGLKEGDVKAEKAAYDNQVAQFKDAYLKKAAAAAPTTDPWYTSLGKAALGGAEQGIGEGVRYVGGGVMALGQGIGNAFQHAVLGNKNFDAATDPSNAGFNSDAYFKGSDPAANAMSAQGKQLQQQAETAHPVAAFAGQLPGAVLSAGVLPTMSAVGNERDAGGSVAQQEGILGINTAANLAGLGLGGTAIKSVGRRLGAQLLGNTAIGVGQNVGSSVVDAKNNPVSAGGTVAQIALSVALSELGARVHLRSEAKTAAAKAEADKLVAESKAKVAAAQQQAAPGNAGTAQAAGNPTNTPAGSPPATAPGTGIPDAQHASVVSEAQQQAQDPSAVKAFDTAVARNPLLKEPAARAQEVINHASAIAEMSAQDSGADWASMSPLQQHEATEAAAQVLAKTTRTEGVPELLQARRAAINTQAAAPQVAETGQPPVTGQAPAAAPAETPQAPTQGEPAAPVAEVPGQESGAPPQAAAPAEATPEPPAAPSPLDSPVDAELAQFGYKPEDLANLKTLDKVQLLTRLKRSEAGPRNGLKTPLADQHAQSLASEAMEGGQAPSPVSGTPSDPLDQTSAQASTLINRQLHGTLDNALGEIRGKLNRKTYSPARLAKMTLEEKHNAYVKETAAAPSATKSETVPGDVQAATAKVDAPGINKINDLGQPRAPGEPLSSKTPVVTTKDVHLAGGVSQDGNTIYIDQRMPKYVRVGGKLIDAHEAVALHERVEWPLMKEMGAVYHDAHDAATAAENHFIRQKYGVDPLKYQDALKAAIKKAGIENRHPGADIPADLDSQPNVDLGDTAPLEGKVSPLSRRGVAAKKAEAPVAAHLPEPTASSETADVVGQTLEGKVTPADLADVRTMVERAQNGMSEDLHARINEMRSDDTITPEEAKALRQAGRETPRNAAERDTGTTKAVDAGDETSLEDMQRSEAPTSELGKAGDDVARAAEEIPTGLKSDRARAAEMIVKLRKLFPDSEPHQKATDFLAWVLGKNPALSRAIKDVAKTPLSAEVNYGGRFGSVSRILELVDRKDMTPSTAVHELMHAAEPLLPTPIRDAILKARGDEIERLAPTAVPAEKAMFEYLQNGSKAKAGGEKVLYMNAARDELVKLRDSGAVPAKRIGELYSLVNSSEYWAVHATDMLHEGYLRKGLWAQAHQWLKGFIDQIRSLFSSHPNRGAIIDGLNHILGTQETGTQAFLRNYELTREQYAGQPEAFTPVGATDQLHNLIFEEPEPAEQKMGRVRRVMANFRETVADNAAYLDNFNEGVRRLGVALTPQQDLKVAFKRMTGQRGENVMRAADDFVEPIKAAIVTHGHLLSNDPVQAEDHLGLFQQLRHIVEERYPQKYREEVPLDNGREVMRQKILQQLQDRKLDPATAAAQLKALVAKNASMPFDDWARQTYGANTKTGETFYDQAVRKLAELRSKGVHAAVEQHFDPLYKALNDEVNRLNIQSGKLAADDPYIAFYGFDHFASLRGNALDGTQADLAGATLPNDLEAIQRMKLKSTNLDKALQTAQGRASFASNPALSALARLEEAARGVANKSFVSTVFDTMGTLKKQLRAQARDVTTALKTETDPAKVAAMQAQLKAITSHEGYNTSVDTYTGVPRDGFDNAATGVHSDQLPTKPNTLVMNDGRNHYVLTFPEGSEVYHSLKAVNTHYDVRDFPMAKPVIEGVEHVVSAAVKPFGLGEQTHLISRSTSFLAQVHTIINPVWEITKLMARLLIEKPFMVTLQHASGPVDGALMLAHVYGNIFGGLFHAGTGDWAVKMMAHDRIGLRTDAAKNPDSMAAWMTRMNAAGGGTAFTQELTMHATRNALAQAGRQSRQLLPMRAARSYLHFTQGLADIAENLPSVGIFRYLVKSGMDDATAGAYTKMAFDLQQTGTAGRAINGYHAFFRIAATATDNLMRAFRHPLGLHEVQVMGRTVKTSVDWTKLAKFGVPIAGYAFAKYYLDREMMGEDADGKNRLAKIASMSPVDLIQNSFVGNGTDKPYTYPMGLGAAQMLTAPGTLMAAVTHGDITMKEAIDTYGETLMRNIPLVEGAPTPQDAGLLAHLFAIGMGAVTPTAATPGVSLATNTNNFGQAIHTAHPNDQLYAADQGKANTPEMWKAIAQSVQQHTGVDFYPETLKFMSENYMGSMPTDLLRATIGQTSRMAQGLPNNALQSVGRMQYQGLEYYDSSRMYKVSQELNETRQQLHSIQLQAGAKGTPEYANAGQQWLSSNPDAQSKLVALNQLTAAQKTYQAGLKALVASKDGPERKQYVRKQLDSALRTATDAAEKTL